MSHEHEILVSGALFVIDPEGKTVSSGEKKKLTQRDHNSTRYGFTMPRYINGHDMSACNIVEIHHINIKRDKRERVEDVYPVTDLQVSQADENKVEFTWLVSNTCTRLEGIVSFALRFACTTEEAIDYEWNTDYCADEISIGEGHYNSEEIVEMYSDILEAWWLKLSSDGGGGGTPDAVQYVPQTLTEEQQAQARDNIGAAAQKDVSKLRDEIVDQNSRIEQAIENEKGNIVNLLIEELQGLPVFGVVDENNTITVTSQLSSGTYTLKYENEDGTLMDVGTITIDGGAIVIVNLLESAVGATGAILNNVGYVDGYYLSSSPKVSGNNSYMSTDSTHFTTGFMPYTREQAVDGVPIYVKGVTIDTSVDHTRIGMYPSYDYAESLAPLNAPAWGTYFTVTELGEQYYKIVPKTAAITFYDEKIDNFIYMRASFAGSGDGVIITVNQEIV